MKASGMDKSLSAPGAGPAAVRSGFTLIEILAAVAVLVILVGILTTVFTESDRAWTLGTGRAMNNSEGRAAVNMVAHDLQYAVADDVLSFKMGPDRNNLITYGFTNDEICCVSLQHDSRDGARTAREVHYYVRESTDKKATALGTGYTSYELARQYFGPDISKEPATTSLHCYTNAYWYNNKDASPKGAGRPSGGGVIADNVVGFHVLAGPNIPHASYESIYNAYKLPQFVDIYLEVMNERDMVEVAKFWKASQSDGKAQNYIERNVKRYTTRVYFHNRMGYAVR